MRRMARLAKTLMVAIIAGMLTGCAFMHVQTPMDRDFDATKLGSKEGRASTRTYLWAVSIGDAGSKAAAGNGGITVINHADTEIYSVLFGLYSRVTTVVYGD
jgi:hypothetical protein